MPAVGLRQRRNRRSGAGYTAAMHTPLTYASVEVLMTRFEASQVAEKEWTHEAHLVAGYWYVRKLGTDAALTRYSRGRLFSVQARRGWVEPDLAAPA